MISLLSWFVVVAVSVVLFYSLSPGKPRYGAKATTKQQFWCAAAVTVLAAGIFSPLYFEYSNYPFSVPVTFKNGSVVRHPYGVFCVTGCGNLLVESVKVTGNVFALTENPKVRRVGFYVSARVVDADKFFVAPIPKHFASTTTPPPHGYYPLNMDYGYIENDSKEVAKLVSAKLFDFKSQYSKDLVTFDNPLDEQQNQRMKRLFESVVNPELEPYGIAITLDRFTVD